MLAVNVGQFLQAVVVRQKAAELLHCFIVPLPSPKTSLAIVAGSLVQLCDKSLVDTTVLFFHCRNVAPF